MFEQLFPVLDTDNVLRKIATDHWFSSVRYVRIFVLHFIDSIMQCTARRNYHLRDGWLTFPDIIAMSLANVRLFFYLYHSYRHSFPIFTMMKEYSGWQGFVEFGSRFIKIVLIDDREAIVSFLNVWHFAFSQHITRCCLLFIAEITWFSFSHLLNILESIHIDGWVWYDVICTLAGEPCTCAVKG